MTCTFFATFCYSDIYEYQRTFRIIVYSSESAREIFGEIIKYKLIWKQYIGQGNPMENQNEHNEEKVPSSKKKSGLADIGPIMLRADQAAAVCGISRSKWYQLQSSGRIPRRIQLGKVSLWKVEDLRLWAREGCPTVDRFEHIMKDNNITPPRF
jgi:predicted DNA-binding transcriptional regulator AlpA